MTLSPSGKEAGFNLLIKLCYLASSPQTENQKHAIKQSQVVQPNRYIQWNINIHKLYSFNVHITLIIPDVTMFNKYR